MPQPDDESAKKSAELRRQAEERRRELSTNLVATAHVDAGQLLQELQVHEIELQLQNDELRRAQRELLASRARYFDLYELAPVGYLTVGKNGLIREANLTAATLLGLQRGELTQQFLTHFMGREDMDIFYLHCKRALETRSPLACELRMIRKDGASFWVHLTANTIADSDDMLEWRVVLRDITERKLAAEAVLQLNADLERRVRERTAELEQATTSLRKSEAQLRATLESTADGILAVDNQGKVLLASRRFVDLWRIPQPLLERGDDRALLDFVLHQLADPDAFIKKVQKLYDSEAEDTDTITFKDGRGFERYSIPMVTDGVRIGRVWSFRDISERKQAAEKLRASKERLREVNALQQLLLASNPVEDKAKFVTDAVVRMVGADFARIWLIKPGDRCDTGCVHAQVTEGPHVCRFRDRCLHLLASSGRYTHTDGGAHARVPFGCYKIGKIAAGEETGFLTNEVTIDPRVHHHAWAKELGLVSFAGHRLTDADGTPLGVLVLFSKTAISAAQQAMLQGISHATSQAMLSARAEESLHASEERFRVLFDEATDGMLLADVATKRFTLTNQQMQRLLGYSEAELLQLTVADLHPAAELPQVIECFERQVRGEVTLSPDLPMRRKDGTVFYVSISSAMIRLQERDYLLGMFRDITNRKRAEAELQQLAAVVRHSSEFIGLATLDGQIIFLNEAGGRMVGIAPEDVARMHILDIFTGSLKAMIQTELLPAVIERGVWEGELQYQNLKTGQLTDVRADCFVITDPATGKPQFLANVSHDVTENKRAEAELTQHRAHLEQLVGERTQDLKDARAAALSLMQDANDQRQRVEQAAALLAVSEQAVRQRAEWAQGLQKAGEELSACATLEDVARVAAQTPVMHLGVRMAWVSVPQDGGLLAPLACSSPDRQRDAETCDCPPRVYASGQKQITPDTLAHPPCKTCRQAAETGDFRSCGTWPILAGGQRIATLTIRCSEVGTDSCVVAAAALIEVFCRQVGYVWERLLTEESLRQREEQHRTILQTAMDGFWLVDLQGRLLEFNETYCRMSGYQAQELQAMRIPDLEVTETTADIAAQMRKIVAQGESRFESRHRRKDGSTFDVEVSAQYQSINGGRCVAFLRDITERKRAEAELIESNRQLKQATARAKEMAIQAALADAAKSAFLANMSHEIRTPMNAILGYAQLLQRDASLSPDALRSLSIMNRSGEHLLNLINDVLEMSKIEAGQLTLRPAAFDLRALLADLASMFRQRTAAKQLAFEVVSSEDLSRQVVSDEGKLRQVLVNLLGNAVKFTECGGIVLRVSTPQDGAGQRRLVAEVEDTGAGIAAEELGRLFRHFEQTASGRQAQEGTGLGLAISRQYAQLLGGDITVTSRVGQGSVFRLEMPLQEAAEVQPIVPAPRLLPRCVIGLQPGQPEWRVLVADDQEANRGWLTKLLAAVGFQVREAADGAEALRVWEAWRPQLILMDMRMPGMDGYEATRQIKARPGGQATQIFATTASVFEEKRQEIEEAGVDAFVGKPLKEGELFQKMQDQLGVQFAFAAEEPPPEAATGPAANPESLARLPSVLVAQLRRALQLGDTEQIRELIRQVGGTDQPLAAALQSLADQYDFDTLSQLLPQENTA